jgi:hypothetical protein
MNTQEQTDLTAKIVMRVHRATGMPLQSCKSHLERLIPAHLAKLLDAISHQRGPTFHDPIEHDPALAVTFETVRSEATTLANEEVERLRQESRRDGLERVEFLLTRGHCRRIWHIMQRLLRERHGIEWLTPVEMSPGVCMD